MSASGKSALALALAERANGVIVNADSAQVYRDLRIVSARPSAEEEARAPHRLYGYRDGAEACSAADWARDATLEIAAAHQAGRLPILVGGTGLYLRTLLKGIAPVPAIDPQVREAVRAMPVVEVYGALTREDPEAAERLRPSDTTRVQRALEVVRSTGRPLAEWQRDMRKCFHRKGLRKSAHSWRESWTRRCR
jgi:tRNA dimethylallyltransferase